MGNIQRPFILFRKIVTIVTIFQQRDGFGFPRRSHPIASYEARIFDIPWLAMYLSEITKFSYEFLSTVVLYQNMVMSSRCQDKAKRTPTHPQQQRHHDDISLTDTAHKIKHHKLHHVVAKIIFWRGLGRATG